MHKKSRYPDTERCQAPIWRRDTYRYTGRTRSGFEMEYDKCRCVRKAGKSGFCWQHEYLGR